MKFLIIEMILIASLCFIISSKLIGTSMNFVRRFIAVLASMIFTTIIYWYTYLNKHYFQDKASLLNLLDGANLLWVGSLLIMTLLFFLLFELFDEVDVNHLNQPQKDSFKFKTLFAYIKRQQRLNQVIKIAIKNGLVQTIKYVRTREDERELARALCLTLQECGGIFVKFGQVLSTRKELFSPIFIEELEKLQQQVLPVSEEQVKCILQENLKENFNQVFSDFDFTPLASASVGQVHKAVLRSNNDIVAVKVLRPNVKKVMKEDMEILLDFTQFISSKSQWVAGLGFYDLAKGFSTSLLEETDLTIEARNLEQINHIVSKQKYTLSVPKIYKEFSTSNILVMELINGKSVADATLLFEEIGLDRKIFARNLLFAFIEQAFVSGIFHADPHPGNIYIDTNKSELVMLDFGAVGRLGFQQREGLKYFLAGINQNKASICVDGIALMIENTENLDRVQMEQAIDQILLKLNHTSKMPTDVLVNSIFSIVRDFGLNFYPSISGILRAIVTIDGTLTTIDNDFDIYNEMRSFSRDFMKHQLTKPLREPYETKVALEEEIALLIPQIRHFPRRMDQFFKKIETGAITLHHDIFSSKENARFISQIFSTVVLLFTAITFAIISVALLAIKQVMNSPYTLFFESTAYLGMFFSTVLLIRLSIKALRDLKR